MANSSVSVQVQNLEKLTKDLYGIRHAGDKALKRTAADLKKRLPGPIATEVAKMYHIDKAEINPYSKDAVPGKTAVRFKIKGDTVASLALIYEGRLLTPRGHGFVLKEKEYKRKPSKIKLKIKKGTEKTLEGRYNTAFMAPVKRGSSVRIPFQRVPSTNKIQAIRTLAVPEMIDNEKVNAAIYERIEEIVNKRVEHNFKHLLGK